LLVDQINHAFQQPAVTAAIGGRQGGGAGLTASGKRVIELYRSIEQIAQSSAKEEFRAGGRLLRKAHTLRALWPTGHAVHSRFSRCVAVYRSESEFAPAAVCRRARDTLVLAGDGRKAGGGFGGAPSRSPGPDRAGHCRGSAGLRAHDHTCARETDRLEPK